MSIERWYIKANAFAHGWKSQFSQDPPLTAVILGLAVAQLETHCGDVWPGAHNWGAVQLRSLTKAEAAVLYEAELYPDPACILAGQRALHDAVECHKIPPITNGSLQVDSSPNKRTAKNPHGYYWVFFQTFPDDAAAAERFVHVLASDRPTCLQVLTSPAGSEQELAAAMRHTGYYEGTHDNSTPEGQQANIDTYAATLRTITPEIRKALAKWSPGTPPPPESYDLGTVYGVQNALNKFGQNPPLLVDGFAGPKTKKAIEGFQRSHGLKVDGVVGQQTIASMSYELRIRGL